MSRTNMKTIRGLDEAALRKKLQETKSELTKLKISGSQGTLRKASGNIRPLRRDIARIMTRLNEMKK